MTPHPTDGFVTVYPPGTRCRVVALPDGEDEAVVNEVRVGGTAASPVVLYYVVYWRGGDRKGAVIEPYELSFADARDRRAVGFGSAAGEAKK